MMSRSAILWLRDYINRPVAAAAALSQKSNGVCVMRWPDFPPDDIIFFIPLKAYSLIH
jgi:hypothetical protein